MCALTCMGGGRTEAKQRQTMRAGEGEGHKLRGRDGHRQKESGEREAVDVGGDNTPFLDFGILGSIMTTPTTSHSLGCYGTHPGAAVHCCLLTQATPGVSPSRCPNRRDNCCFVVYSNFLFHVYQARRGSTWREPCWRACSDSSSESSRRTFASTSSCASTRARSSSWGPPSRARYARSTKNIRRPCPLFLFFSV